MAKNKFSTFLSGVVIAIAMAMFVPSTANATWGFENSHSHKAKYHHGYNCDTQCTTYKNRANTYRYEYYRTYNYGYYTKYLYFMNQYRDYHNNYCNVSQHGSYGSHGSKGKHGSHGHHGSHRKHGSHGRHGSHGYYD